MASLWLVVSSAGWIAGWNVGAACNWTKQQPGLHILLALSGLECGAAGRSPTPNSHWLAA